MRASNGAQPAAPAVSGRSQVFGVIGFPVAHSLSPAMHNAAFAAVDYPGIYVPFPVEPGRLPEAMAGVRALGLGGVNVTVPHKEAVMAHLDEITPMARRVGAVNTVIHREGRLIGDNTDGRGFLRSLREELGVEPGGLRTVILGAGGAARAIGAALLEAGVARLVIANRTGERARSLLRDLLAAGWPSPAPGPGGEQGGEEGEAPVAGDVAAMALDDPALEGEVAGADVLIHTTTWGMAPEADVPPLIPAHWLHPRTAVCDIVYAPLETSLLREARARGCRVLSGLGMLLYQGALAFEAWTGRKAPVDVMRRALESRLDAP